VDPEDGENTWARFPVDQLQVRPNPLVRGTPIGFHQNFILNPEKMTVTVVGEKKMYPQQLREGAPYTVR
jgi:hypothetical protein